MRFYDSDEDCIWLKEKYKTKLKNVEVGAFILYGNEDYPEKVEVYKDKEPLNGDPFITVSGN